MINNHIERILKKAEEENIDDKIFEEEFGSIEYVDKYDDTILHLLAMNRNITTFDNLMSVYNSLLLSGISVNSTNSYENSFLHELINNSTLSLNQVKIMLYQICKRFPKININAINCANETILHLFIKRYSVKETKDFVVLLRILNFNFDNLKEKSLVEYIKANTNYTPKEINELLKTIKDEKKKMIPSKREKKKNSNLGRILTDQYYYYAPAVGREKEIQEIIVTLATDKRFPLIVGKPGVGKTSLVDQLAYLIQSGQIPSFLKGKTIFETSASDILANTAYRGDLENNIKEIFNFVRENNSILFIDDFHNIFRNAESQTSNISSIIKHYIDRDNAHLIATTTEDDYQSFIANSSLNRRFEIIQIDEPDNKLLYDIVKNYIIVSSMKRYVSLDKISDILDEIINILIVYTSKKHRIYSDMVYNPDLIISIIDKSISYAVYEDSPFLSIDHIIKSLKNSKRIYNGSIQEACFKLSQLKPSTFGKKRALIIDFRDYKKE